MKLKVLPGTYAVCRINTSDTIPAWALNKKGFLSITRTDEEISIICEENEIEDGLIKKEAGWSAIKVVGPLDFGMIGVLSSISNPLAKAGISIFVISTYDTDYVLVKSSALQKTKDVLLNNGFAFV